MFLAYRQLGPVFIQIDNQRRFKVHTQLYDNDNEFWFEKKFTAEDFIEYNIQFIL